MPRSAEARPSVFIPGESRRHGRRFQASIPRHARQRDSARLGGPHRKRGEAEMATMIANPMAAALQTADYAC